MATEQKPPKELNDWQKERAEGLRRIELFKRQGVCYICRDLKTREVFGKQHVVFEDPLFRVVLSPYPRVEGHSIVVYKPHREDAAALSDDEAGQVFCMCARVVRAIKHALGAERVYILTMADGQTSHLNFQLFPRWPGNIMGYRRLSMLPGPLKNGKETADSIRTALLAMSPKGRGA